jgi:hypothetical protein
MPALPSLSHYFDQLNANHAAMMSKLDEVIGAVQAVGTAVQGVETAVQGVQTGLSGISDQITAEGVKLTAIEAQTHGVKPALDTISGQITAEGVKLTAIEGYTAGITPAVQAVETAVQALRGTGDTTLYDLLQELQAVETATQSIRGDKTLEEIYDLLVSLQGGTTFSDLATGEVIDCTLRGLIEKIHKLQGLPLDPRSGEAQYTQVTFRTLYDILGGADPGTAEPLGIWDSVTEAMGFIDDGLGIFDNIRGLAQLGVASANVGTTAATAAGTYITAAALAMMSYQIEDLHNTLKNNNVATDGIFTGMNALTSETTTAGRVGLVDVRSDLAAQISSLAGISGQITAEGTKLTAIESYTADFVTQLELLMSGEQHQTGTNLADLLVKLHCICQGVSELVLNAPAQQIGLLEPPAGGTGGSVDCQRARWIVDTAEHVMSVACQSVQSAGGLPSVVEWSSASEESMFNVVGQFWGVELSGSSAHTMADLMNTIIRNDKVSGLWSEYDAVAGDLRCALVNASGAGAAKSAIASIATGASDNTYIQQMIGAIFPIEVLNALYSGTIPLDPRKLDSYSSDCSDCGDPPCCAGVDLGPVACTSQWSVDGTNHLSKFPLDWPCVSGSTDPGFGYSALTCFVADGCELTIVLTDITTAELNISQPYTEPTPGTLVFTSVGADVSFSNNTPTPFNYTARLREI